MALKLNLKPGERVVVNGALIRNSSDSRTSIVIENKASILREKDFMRESEAITPARRLYFLCMLAYLDEAGSMAHRQAFVEWLGEVMRALQNPEAKALSAEASFELARGNYYKALSACRQLIRYENNVLGVPGQSEASVSLDNV